MVIKRGYIILALVAGLMFIFLLRSVPMVVSSVQGNPFTSRSYVLRTTPIGTYIADVEDTIRETEKWKMAVVSYDRGLRLRKFGQSVIVGDKFLRANGRQGVFSTTIIGESIFWVFDKDGILIDVYVQRMISP